MRAQGAEPVRGRSGSTDAPLRAPSPHPRAARVPRRRPAKKTIPGLVRACRLPPLPLLSLARSQHKTRMAAFSQTAGEWPIEKLIDIIENRLGCSSDERKGSLSGERTAHTHAHTLTHSICGDAPPQRT